jgi:hypothetical protein
MSMRTSESVVVVLLAPLDVPTGAADVCELPRWMLRCLALVTDVAPHCARCLKREYLELKERHRSAVTALLTEHGTSPCAARLSSFGSFVVYTLA